MPVQEFLLGGGTQDAVGEGLAEVAVSAEAGQGRVVKNVFGFLTPLQYVEV